MQSVGKVVSTSADYFKPPFSNACLDKRGALSLCQIWLNSDSSRSHDRTSALWTTLYVPKLAGDDCKRCITAHSTLNRAVLCGRASNQTQAP